MNREPARIDIEHLSVNYNSTPALQDICLQIPHGARVAVVGPNGAGKSTLFKVLVGEEPIDSGQILIHGRPLAHHRDCVAYVPQREDVDWSFPVTVEDVVLMGRCRQSKWFTRTSSMDRAAAHRSLEQLGILDLSSSAIGDLSGGQQQRVFLARALAQEPHIMLLDEPFNGVDVPTQEAILDLLKELKVRDVTVLVSTHDFNLAMQHFDRAILLNKRLIAYDTPERVFTHTRLQEAFSDRVMVVDGHAIIDECCPPDESQHHHRKR